MSDDTYDDRDYLLMELIDEEGADDTRELHEPDTTHNSLFSTLQKEYNDLLVNETTVEDVKSSQSLHMLQYHINRMKEKWPRTGRLWLMLMQIVAIVFEASVQETGIFISKPHRICCPTLLQLATTSTKVE